MLVTRGLGIASPGLVTFGLGIAAASEDALARGYASDGLWLFSVTELGVSPLSLADVDIITAGSALLGQREFARQSAGEWLMGVPTFGISLSGAAVDDLRAVVATSATTHNSSLVEVTKDSSVGSVSKHHAADSTEPTGSKQGAK